MSVLDRIALVAAGAGAYLAPAPSWRRVFDAGSGLSFETPFDLQAKASPLGTLSDAFMTLPFVLDATFMTSQNDASPEALTWAMAAQWAIDYDLVAGATVRRADYPGVDEAWILSAEVRDEAGVLGSSWVTFRKEGTIACLGVNCWIAEPAGHEASLRILGPPDHDHKCGWI